MPALLDHFFLIEDYIIITMERMKLEKEEGEKEREGEKRGGEGEKDTTDLKNVRETLLKSFVHISDKMRIYQDDEQKLVRLIDAQQKVARALIDCLSLEQKAIIRSENKDNVYRAIISLIEKTQRESGDKRALQVFKTWLETEETGGALKERSKEKAIPPQGDTK